MNQLAAGRNYILQKSLRSRSPLRNFRHSVTFRSAHLRQFCARTPHGRSFHGLTGKRSRSQIGMAMESSARYVLDYSLIVIQGGVNNALRNSVAVGVAGVGSGYLVVGRTCTVRPFRTHLKRTERIMTNKKVLIVTYHSWCVGWFPTPSRRARRQCLHLLRRIIPESTFAIVRAMR